MAEPRWDEAMLAGAAARLEYPPAPDLRASVLAAIAAGDAGQPNARQVPPAIGFPRRPAYASYGAMAALTVLGAVIALLAALAVPTSRDAIADFFGIEGSRIETLPTPAPGDSATPLPTPARLEDIGSRSTVIDAQRLVGFELALPGGRQPREVYTVLYGGEYAAILRYDGFDLWQARPREVVFGKGLPQGVTWTELVVRGLPAAWIEGGPHVLTLRDDTGDPIPGSSRVVEGNTLIWNSGYALYRIETALPQSEAVRIAESLR